MADPAADDPVYNPEHVPGRMTYLVCVDDSHDCRVALRYAALRATNTGGYVALLYVVEPADFQHWVGVGEVMEEEAREEGERVLQTLAGEVYEMTGLRSILHLRQGRKGEEILKLMGEDPTIDVMVLGAAPEGGGSNELVRLLTEELTKRLRRPLVIVPGNLTDEQLRALT